MSDILSDRMIEEDYYVHAGKHYKRMADPLVYGAFLFSQNIHKNPYKSFENESDLRYTISDIIALIV